MTNYRSIDLEFSIAPILARQQEHGVLFDTEAAEKLLAELQAKKSEIRLQLQEVFKPRVLNRGEFIPKVNYSRGKGCDKVQYKKGGVYTKIEFQEYNPSSRQQTIDRLCKEMGWQPAEFTDKGNPEFDEEIIESLPFENMKPLKDFYIINKRIGQIESGKNSWLNVVKDNNRIYGGLLQSGTNTRRCTHFGPNLAQVPANDKPYGKECRALFKVPKGKIMIGCDADALEMRTLAGFMKPIDGGKFIKTVLEGKKELGTDMHTLNTIAYGIDKYEGARELSKLIFYGSLYGCRNPKRGLMLQQWGIDFYDYVPKFDEQFEDVKRWATNKRLGFSDKYLECLVAGKHCQDLYGQRLPELPELIKNVTAKWKERGYLIALDGGRLYPRSEHSVFNILNQAAGAVIMKQAIVIADAELQRRGLVPGRDYEQILFIHDETQYEVEDNKEIIEIVKEVLPDSIYKAGLHFRFPCIMRGNVSIGDNWSETH